MHYIITLVLYYHYLVRARTLAGSGMHYIYVYYTTLVGVCILLEYYSSTVVRVVVGVIIVFYAYSS